jgi:MFS family permease
VTIVMFALSRRFGAIADAIGPRRLMGAGPLVAAAGIFLLLRLGTSVSYVADLLPAMLLFAVGLSMTVAPLTATVLADADDSDAGIASAINNAVARVAGLIGVSAVGAAIAGRLPGDTFARNAASVTAFHHAVLICGVLVAAGGIIGLIGIEDPPHAVDARHCAGGQLVGAPARAART